MGRPRRGRNYLRNKARRDRAFARAKWLWTMLIYSLGGECEICRETELTLLSVDHVDGAAYHHRSLRYDARVARYVQEYAEGSTPLRVLCIPCNSSYRPNRQPGDDVEEDLIVDRREYGELEEAPF